MGHGSREDDLLGKFMSILATSSLVTVAKVEKVGRGISGDIYF